MENSTLDQLAKLSAQRTARTDRLHTAVQALLGQLDKVAEVGDHVEVDGRTLALELVSSNVGADQFWVLGGGCDGYEETFVYLERDIDSYGYLHGDFHAPLRGPGRSDLIAFAARAERFVEGLIALQGQQVADLDAGIASVEAAVEKVQS